jgi:hypothetical protein
MAFSLLDVSQAYVQVFHLELFQNYSRELYLFRSEELCAIRNWLLAITCT